MRRPAARTLIELRPKHGQHGRRLWRWHGGMAEIAMVLAHSPIRPEGDSDDHIELLPCLTVREQLNADA